MHAAGLWWGCVVAMAGGVCLALTTGSAAAEPVPTNYDEALVRSYTLPDLLAGPDQAKATTPQQWRAEVRPHQLRLLEQFVYGRRPAAVPVVAEMVERESALNGRATRVQARLRLGNRPDAHATEVLLYIPTALTLPTSPAIPTSPATASAPKKFPVFLHLNFAGNHAESADADLRLPLHISAPQATPEAVTAAEAARGTKAVGWPIQTILERGYATATATSADFYPDNKEGQAQSVLPGLGYADTVALRAADEPGSLGAWAWGLSRILDWLVTLPEIDASRGIVVGHSRLGKAALWAGAGDERFAMVVSNNSGCGGAALERRNFGETVAKITTRFPHWFCPTLATYGDREVDLPVDQHTLLAMVAPRPLYVASAVEDRWADPRGEFLGAVAAEPAWKLFGLEGLGTTQWPPVDTPIGHQIGYHLRSGKHDLLEYDWLRFADFADRVLPGK